MMIKKTLLALALLLALVPMQAQRFITPLGSWNGDRQFSLYGGVVPTQGGFMFEYDNLDNDFLSAGGEVTPLTFSADMSYAAGIRLQMISLDRHTLRWGLYLSVDGYRSGYSVTLAGKDLQMSDITGPQEFSATNNYRFRSEHFNIGMKFGAEGVYCPTERLDITAGLGIYVDIAMPATVTKETLQPPTDAVVDQAMTKHDDLPNPHAGPYVDATMSFFLTDHLFAGLSATLTLDAFSHEQQVGIEGMLTRRYAPYAPYMLCFHMGYRL